MLGLGELVEHLDLAVVVTRHDHVAALKIKSCFTCDMFYILYMFVYYNFVAMILVDYSSVHECTYP